MTRERKEIGGGVAKREKEEEEKGKGMKKPGIEKPSRGQRRNKVIYVRQSSHHGWKVLCNPPIYMSKSKLCISEREYIWRQKFKEEIKVKVGY